MRGITKIATSVAVLNWIVRRRWAHPARSPPAEP